MIKLVGVLVEAAIATKIILEIIKEINNRVDSDQTDNPESDKEQR